MTRPCRPSAPFGRSIRTGLAGFVGLVLGLVPLGARCELPKRTILSLQTLAQTARDTDAGGNPVELVDLNPTVGRWYLLRRGSADASVTLNLETPDGFRLALGQTAGMLTVRHGEHHIECPLDGKASIAEAAAGGLPYAPACGGTVWVRTQARGKRTMLEAATELLRTTGGTGEMLINFYKNNFNDTAEAASYGQGLAPVVGPGAGNAPPPAQNEPAWQNRTTDAGSLGLPLTTPSGAGPLHLGAWYEVKGQKDTYASVTTPEAAGAAAEPGHANQAYFVAWDMAHFSLRYTVGTTHPALGWSDRAPAPHVGPGPDGFDEAAPLARVGMVPPYDESLLAGVFAGGFKREHGAFRTGENVGLHYGFAEDGVVLSRLQPRMVTVLVTADGQPAIRTLTEAQAARGADGLLFARQAGYALLENGAEGAHVPDINGNWSGSNEGHLLTMRSGVCLMPANGTTYLVYGVFSAATPKAMAVTFKAFGCRDAALLDMNNPTLVYSAVYRRDQGRLVADHLTKSMEKSDENGRLRFVDDPDSRDFFYLLHR